MSSSPQQKLIAVAVDKDKGSQAALKWAIETVCQKGQKLLLIHVKLRPQGTTLAPTPDLNEISRECNAFDELDTQTRDLLLPFRVFCSRKNIHSQEIVLEDVDIAKALIEFVKISGIEVLVLGAAARYLFRFKIKDTPGNVLKGVPDFCTVYIIAKGKISTSRPASRSAPPVNSFRNQILQSSNMRSCSSFASASSEVSIGSSRTGYGTPDRYQTPSRYETSQRYYETPSRSGDFTQMRSPFTNRRGPNGKLYEYSPAPESDISFVSSGRPSIESLFPSFTDSFEDPPERNSDFSDLDRNSTGPRNFSHLSIEATNSDISSYASLDNDSYMFHNVDDDDSEMYRLKQELKQTMEMYSTACKEALSAKQKALELQNWKMEEQRKLEEARRSELAARIQVEQEKAKTKTDIEHAEAARRIAELDSQKRVDCEMKALKEVEERDNFSTTGLGYRRYTIEEIEDATDYFSQSRKIGEGGYGPVYQCHLDHTPVAVKVLRSDEVQGRSQFQQEVQVLSCIRHPNMVLLLGACPEYGCLVYEYMSYGSLEDRLMQRGNSPPLPWQHRFRIAAEITTGLLFLHHTKPEPIVHRDLKPGNILLDRNLVSKISDVGMARLVPASVADTVTQYRMTSTAGTFCYIDPEYQQTGMLGVKSDVYSLGIIFLQILTSRPPMGLAHQVRSAIESGTFTQMLDSAVPDWPVEDALCLANLALQCCELRRKDRPDLGKVVMPQLQRLRELSEESYSSSTLFYPVAPSHVDTRTSISQDEMSYSTESHSGFDSSTS